MATLPPEMQGPNSCTATNLLPLVTPKVTGEHVQPPSTEDSSPKKRVAMVLAALGKEEGEESLLQSKSRQPQQQEGGAADAVAAVDAAASRERLKRHRREVAGRVWIPEAWGKEPFLKDWSDCAALDRALFPTGLLLAREALVDECRRRATASPPGEAAAAARSTFRIGNSC